MSSLSPLNFDSQVILYQTEDGHTRIEVRFNGETAWLSLNQMAELFQRDKSAISKHIRNIFSEGELAENSTVAKFATVQAEGSREKFREIKKRLKRGQTSYAIPVTMTCIYPQNDIKVPGSLSFMPLLASDAFLVLRNPPNSSLFHHFSKSGGVNLGHNERLDKYI